MKTRQCGARLLPVLLALALAAAAGGAAATAAHADGFMIGQETGIPHHEIRPEPLSVTYHRVKVRITGGIAVTTIDQEFFNHTGRDLEGEYLFPLPRNVTVTELALYIDGRRVTARVLDSNRADEIYRDIVRRMKDPAILEYLGRNTVRLRVYPIPAGGSRRMEVRYVQTLERSGNTFRYVYPLDTEQFSPTPLEQVVITAHIRSDTPIKNIYSPSHEVDVTRETHTAVVGYEASEVRPDRDFQLYYTVSEQEIDATLLTYTTPGKEGWFALLLSPGHIDEPAVPKDVVFVMDTSGSMRGEKIEQARAALDYCVQNLAPGDRFNLVQFATTATLLRPGLVEAAAPGKTSAARFISKLKARGGTNIGDALAKALKQFDDSTRPKMVVFITDGEPTVGETDPGAILRALQAANTTDTRVFVFGVGYDVNTHLLDLIAGRNRGSSDYLDPGQDLNTVVSGFFRKVSEPVVTGPKVDLGTRTSDVYPVDLHDLFNGAQQVILGRFSGRVRYLTVKGMVNGRERVWEFPAPTGMEHSDHDFLPRLWAGRKIGYLLGEIRLNGESPELVDEIVRLSREYGILTPYTSALVLESETDYRDLGLAPSAADEMAAGGRSFKKGMAQQKGKESVDSARKLQEVQQQSSALAPAQKTTRYAGEKTFYLVDGVWRDAAVQDSGKIVKVAAFSNEYFRLLKSRPELARYFAVGRNVLVQVGRTVYMVID
jgi:Ca-activated chloride channel family protein